MPKDDWKYAKKPRGESDLEATFKANYKQTDKGLVYVGPRKKSKFKPYTGNEPIRDRRKNR